MLQYNKFGVYYTLLNVKCQVKFSSKLRGFGLIGNILVLFSLLFCDKVVQ